MRVAVPAGLPIAVARNRVVGSRLWTPSPVAPDSVNYTTSSHVQATATAHATPHTKGSWTEVIAATTKRCTLLRVRLAANSNSSGANSSTLIDIGVGAAAAESVIIPDVPFGYGIITGGGAIVYDFPVWIPVGSRIAIRSQSAITVHPVTLQFETLDLPFDRLPPSNLINMGADAATSKGVNLAVPGSANTKGAWTEIVAATTQPLRHLIAGVQGAADAGLAASAVLVDVGAGAAGGEQVVIPDIQFLGSTAEAYSLLSANSAGVSIPAGSRLAARYAAVSTGNSVDVALIGVPA